LQEYQPLFCILSKVRRSFNQQEVPQVEQGKYPKLSIIIPTFREVMNIPLLVREIAHDLKSQISDWELIIVDDDSRDGTVAICESLQKSGFPLKLVVRKNERGLARAVIEGFKHARAPIFVVMDGDLSHMPAVVPLLYEAIQNGAEFAIGSRYIPGGGTDDKWTFYRYLNSKFASLLARPLVALSDPMSGFFCPAALAVDAMPGPLSGRL
jgi:dolichol-phosphate mannosyltransferase